MRIAIDASRTTVQRLTGTERYARDLLHALAKQNTKHELTYFFRDQPDAGLFPASPRIRRRVIPFPRLWTHGRLGAALWETHPDLTFVPAHTLPFIFPGKALVTIHDLGYQYFPQAHTATQRHYLDLTTRYSARRATIILADSQATAHDLTRFYDTPVRKIRVVYPGVSAPPSPFAAPIDDDARQAAVTAVRSKYHVPESYWLYLGTMQPRKNIAGVVQGYARWKKRRPNTKSALVLAGARGWLFDPEWIKGVDGIIETGYLDDADKWALYAGAKALLFPSLYEGFGFPVIEAMHCGTPVICSRASSLPELGGEAAYYIDLPALKPGGHLGVTLAELAAYVGDQLAEYMDRVADEAHLEPVRARRSLQAAQFTWERAAGEVLAVFDCLERGDCE